MIKNVVLSFIVGLLILTNHNVYAQYEKFTSVREVFKTGNAKEVSAYLDQSIEMRIDGNIDSYSKAQAEFVLRDFFKKHPPTEVSIVHARELPQKNLHFAICRYQSNSERYNLLVRMKEINGQNLITELTFDK